MSSFRSGFTLIEILVVITILLVISLFSMYAIRQYAFDQQFQAAEQLLVTTFREARQMTVAAESDTKYGLLFSTDEIIRFVGEDSSADPEQHHSIEFLAVEVITNLSDVSNEITFARLSGRPSATGTVEIRSIHTNRARTFLISDSGLLLPHP